MKVINRGVS